MFVVLAGLARRGGVDQRHVLSTGAALLNKHTQVGPQRVFEAGELVPGKIYVMIDKNKQQPSLPNAANPTESLTAKAEKAEKLQGGYRHLALYDAQVTELNSP